MTKEITLSQDKIALVDDEDHEWLDQWKWSYDGVYACRMTSRRMGPRRKLYLHRELAVRMGLLQESTRRIDHKNLNPLDNTRANIREATHAQNLHNVAKRKTYAGQPTQSKYKGVCSDKRGYWIAVITPNGNRHRIGRFRDEIQAAKAYDQAAREYYGEFAYTNF